MQSADILVIGTPNRLGEKPSVCTTVIERPCGSSHTLDDAGRCAYHAEVGGCLVAGNEDGAQHRAMNIPYSRRRAPAG